MPIPNFTSGIANEKYKIILPTGYLPKGQIKIKLSGGWNISNGLGVFEKTISIVSNPGVINQQRSSYTNVDGFMSDRVAIGDIKWNGSTGNFEIVISKLADANDTSSVGMTIEFEGVALPTLEQIKQITLSEIYTTDPTIPPKPALQVRGNEIWHEGNLDPSTIGGGNVYATTEDINYYVSPTGSDSNDGTETTPFLTIQKAIDMLPQVINHRATITVSAGISAPTTINLIGFSGKNRITFVSDASGTPIISLASTMALENNTCPISFYDFEFPQTANGYIRISNCTDVYLFNLTINSEEIYGVDVYSSNVRLSSVIINNVENAAIYAENNSNVATSNNSGTGNAIGLKSNGSIIFKEGTQPTGTTAEAKIAGGQIF